MVGQGAQSEVSLPQYNDEHGQVKSLVRSPRTSWLSGTFVLGPIDPRHTDLLLLAHSLATGIIDAATFANYAVFAGMQTGNTVLLGLSAATTPSNPHAWLTTLVSITSYLLGALLTFRLTSLVLPSGLASNRLYLSLLLFLQAALVLLPAALIAADLIPHNPPGMVPSITAAHVLENVHIVAVIPPLAFQAGMQIATSRLLGFNELPVNVLTSTYCDIMGDKHVLKRDNEKRNRRVASVVLLLAGAVGAGWIMRSRAGTEGALFVAAAIKAGAAVAGFVFLGRGEKAS
ncbi:hypothetical protein CAC42_2477 [Sphaceloma murrayae]|uniref:DUF1275 domain protein n=1 Tax=Sphaceloma murrayae TaxID=2082308 RepID=A0A2K1QWG1_9PEZI|nr:hypothetical protein CAC42_2477 [Sphaceloma murrayae]